MRPIWKGSISFGLVTIPVRLYAATERKDPKFNYLHQPCGSPVRYLKWCPYCNREVPAEEIVWGYEYEKGRYVLLNEEDLNMVPAPEARALTIEDFIDIREIDPIYYDKTYFLEPGDGGARAYALLRQAMLDRGRIALARVALRSRETLATIRVYGGQVLVMETMMWPDEIRDTAGLQIPALGDVDRREAQMAQTLVDTLSAPFEPARYRSRGRERLVELIEAKVQGREIQEPRLPEAAKVVDLMEALKKSIARAGEGRPTSPAAEAGGAAGERAGGLPH
ncbi:MAG: Ku protein [Firmicutes bacterium]|nr:Ku protein [Bacillota bacterium]